MYHILNQYTDESMEDMLRLVGQEGIVEIRPDHQRERRKGAPEVILGETKEAAQIVAMARALLENSGRAIISRVRPEVVGEVREAFAGYRVQVREAARAITIY